MGSSEQYDIDEKIVYPEDKDLEFSSHFSGKLTFIRLKNEVCALLNDAGIEVLFTCNRCLKTFKKTIEIAAAERQYYYGDPDFESDDLDDLFFIDKKPMTINLNEMVRQEIILHFPLIPVCSKSCKGLCPVCGKDRNTVKCKCVEVKEQGPDTYKPFKDLKKLI